MLYFSLTTLTTTGYGDIVPVDPFARSLANLESLIGQFYLAITVARLVTLEMEHRSR
jgi:voltage-gated potassium channel Kch